MDFELFDTRSRHPHQDAGYDDIPPARERQGNPFWEFVGGMLGLPAPKPAILDDDRDGRPFMLSSVGTYSPFMSDDERLAAMRRREAELARLNGMQAVGPPRVTLGDLASEVVEAVREAVKPRKPTELQRAKTWLQETLAGGPMLATAVEKLAIKAGISKRTLRRAAKSVKVQSRRKGRGPWVWTPLQAEGQA